MAPSSCGSRTPTRRATGPSGPTGSSPPSTGSAWRPTRARTSSRSTRRTHEAAIEALWSSGALYACGCTREEIDERTRLRAAAGDPTPGYDGYCRDLGLPRGEGRALRFRTPDEGVVRVVDLVRGDVEFPQRALEDFICVKGNGKPLFVLANAVDDRSMAITHVIRGEDQLPTTPRQIMLWDALNSAEGRDLPLPAYAHLPLLVNERGKKLSKRRDPVAVEMYREQGYLPAAFRNYLALLGWSPGDEEIVPVETLIERFRSRGRAALAGLLRRQEAGPHERRVHP